MKRINPGRYPKYHMKYSRQPLFNASEFTRNMEKSPENVIFVYYQKLAQSIASELGLKPTNVPYGDKLMVSNFTNDASSIYVMMPGAGAPMTATVADELHSFFRRHLEGSQAYSGMFPRQRSLNSSDSLPMHAFG